MFGCFLLGHVIFFLWFFLLFLLFGRFFRFRSFFLLLGGSFLLWCYITLAGQNSGNGTCVVDALFDKFGRTHDGEVGFEVADQGPVSHDIRICSPVFAVKQLTSFSHSPTKKKEAELHGERGYVLETTIKIGGDDEISNSQSFADKVGMILQVTIKVLHDPFHEFFGHVDVFLVVRIATKCGTEPSTETREEFMVCKGHPLNCLSVGLYVLGDESRVWVLLSNYTAKLANQTQEREKQIVEERISIVISA